MDDQKKIERKRKRFSVRLKGSKGITCTDSPCPNIVLCNVGQATGFGKEHVMKLLEKLSEEVKLVKFIAEKGESYCFLLFNCTASAYLFYKTFNGKPSSEFNNTIVYMNYVENVPNSERTITTPLPNGLNMITNFISEEEERILIKLFDLSEDANLKNRQVKHYGYEFRYGSNDVDLSCPLSEKIPHECDILWDRLKIAGYDIKVPDQLTVNKYTPGQGIPSHVDKHSPFEDTILSLSLGSQVVMDWKHHSGKYVPLVLPGRSLLVMQGESRYDWQHGIQPRTWDPVIQTRDNNQEIVKVITGDTEPRGTRISLTFRSTRLGPCQCGYEVLCDKSGGDIYEDLASNLEELHVHQVYEQIAGHFSSTRHTPWPKVVEFLRDVPTGAIVLDLGAGNGKNILRRNDIAQIAGERSDGLLQECANSVRGLPAQAVRLDLLHLPLRDGCADAAICIAVIHHFCNKGRRRQAVSNIARLLRPGGRVLITVWAKDQKKSSYLCQSKESQQESRHATVGGLNLPVHENRTQFQHNDLLVPWKLRRAKDQNLEKTNSIVESEATLLRYYHVFEEGELDDLCEPDLVIEKSFYEQGNWCVICKKV